MAAVSAASIGPAAAKARVREMAAKRINKFIRGLVSTSFDFQLSYGEIPEGGRYPWHISQIFIWLIFSPVLAVWEGIVLAKYKALTEQVYDADKLTKQIRNLVWNTRRNKKITSADTENNVDGIMNHFKLGDELSQFLTIHRLPLSLLHGIYIIYIYYYHH